MKENLFWLDQDSIPWLKATTELTRLASRRCWFTSLKGDIKTTLKLWVWDKWRNVLSTIHNLQRTHVRILVVTPLQSSLLSVANEKKIVAPGKLSQPSKVWLLFAGSYIKSNLGHHTRFYSVLPYNTLKAVLSLHVTAIEVVQFLSGRSQVQSPSGSSTTCAFLVPPDKLWETRLKVCHFCLLHVFYNTFRITKPCEAITCDVEKSS
jgi:hypothetical protein